MTSIRNNLPAVLGAILVMILAAVAFRALDFGDGSADTTTVVVDDELDRDESSASVDSPAETPVREASPRFSDLPEIRRVDLPLEAIDALDLVAQGGPYPFRQDDGVFQNREGHLPDEPANHYREYTVVTPGSDDRGARRIVAGADGALYYTDDHYDSFREIVVER